MDFSTLISKAEVLNEALPYIQKFKDSIVAIKFGGSAMEDPVLIGKAMQDIVLLNTLGMKIVVIHGGGKAISAKLKEMGLGTQFINGLRVTDEATIGVVDDVLHNNNNRTLVEDICKAGGKAISLSGKKIMRAEKLYSTDKETGEKLDIGFVGKVVAVDTKPILDALAYNCIPVIAPLATDFYGQVYNINADTAACEITKALQARKLVFLSDVPGIMRDPADETTLISEIRTSDVPALVEEGVLSGGMLPKIQSSVEAINAGVREVHMIDGRVPHALLLEIFTDNGIGTEILEG